ncbi:MAG: hypothetical protein Q7S37_04080 [bacterium]|nr:hypothetical protein [bacterium]
MGECKRIYHSFSVPELFRTLFSPWKRDEVPTDNLSLGDKFHVWVGNLATRFVAFIIRSFTIIIGFFMVGFIFIFGITLIVIDLAFPLLIVLMVIWGTNGF